MNRKSIVTIRQENRAAAEIANRGTFNRNLENGMSVNVTGELGTLAQTLTYKAQILTSRNGRMVDPTGGARGYGATPESAIQSALVALESGVPF